MSTSIGPTYDPASTAAALAEKYTASRQQILKTQSGQASAVSKALSTLNSAILSYQTSLGSLTGLNKTMLSKSATFGDTSIGSASASAAAAAGSYSFFVETLATASQMAYNGFSATAVKATGSLDVSLGLGPQPPLPSGPGPVAFTVDLTVASIDPDQNGITVRELAAAINAEPTNAARVTATVVTIDGIAQLTLTAKNTGTANTVSLTPSAGTDQVLKDALAAPKEMVAAQDALVWLGAKGSGTPISQGLNTFTNIDGVKMTFTRAQAAGDSPVTLTVADDNGGTTANVQSFIDAYNNLKTVVDGMVDAGDPSTGAAAGAFAHDSGVKALQNRLVSMLRQAGSSSLAAFGITAGRDGMLKLDGTRLTRQLALDPNGLDKLIGSTAGTTGSGIAGSLDTYLKQWSSSVNGQIKQRKDANDKLQTELTKRQDLIDGQYNSAYQRYLLQFTQLQSLQSQMTSNTTLFTALFGDKSN